MIFQKILFNKETVKRQLPLNYEKNALNLKYYYILSKKITFY